MDTALLRQDPSRERGVSYSQAARIGFDNITAFD
jgi:hypothetical protein